MPNSVTRFEASKVVDHFKKISKNQNWNNSLKTTKTFSLTKKITKYINSSKKGVLITDNDYEDGLPRILSGKINEITSNKIYILGLRNRTAGHHKKVDNLPPDANKIIKFIKNKIKI